MSDSLKDPQSDDDRALNDLIRAATDAAPNEFIRPDEAVIQAYVLGRANRSQKREIRSALLLSEAFRREIAALSEELELIESPAAKVDFEAATPGHIPVFAHLVRQAPYESPSPFKFAQFLKKLFRTVYLPRLAAATAAVVLITVVAILYFNRDLEFPSASLQLVSAHIETELLIPTQGRGSTATGTPEIYASAQEAALAAFRRRLEFRDGRFLITPSEQTLSQTRLGRRLQLMVEQAGDNSVEVNADVDTEESNQIIGWILALPSQSLRTFAISADQAQIEWRKEFGESGLIAFTWTARGGHRSSAAVSF